MGKVIDYNMSDSQETREYLLTLGRRHHNEYYFEPKYTEVRHSIYMHAALCCNGVYSLQILMLCDSE